MKEFLDFHCLQFIENHWMSSVWEGGLSGEKIKTSHCSTKLKINVNPTDAENIHQRFDNFVGSGPYVSTITLSNL